MKKLLATTATATVLALGGIAVAGAVSPAPDAPADAPADGGAGPGFGRHHRGDVLRNALATAAETIGITEDELLEAIRSGQTVAEVAEDRDVEAQAVVDALVAAGTEHIDAAVAEGKLDEQQAANLKQRLPEFADRLVNETPHRAGGPGEGEGPRPGFGHGPLRAGLETAAEVIGITEQELAQELRAGRTIAEVATEHDVDPQDVIDSLVEQARDRIEQFVNEGRPEGPRSGDDVPADEPAVETAF